MPATVSREMIANLTVGVQTVYADAYQPQRNVWSQIATLLPSTLAVETYAWIGELPTMRSLRTSG